jgi:hypothetical protein
MTPFSSLISLEFSLFSKNNSLFRSLGNSGKKHQSRLWFLTSQASKQTSNSIISLYFPYRSGKFDHREWFVTDCAIRHPVARFRYLRTNRQNRPHVGGISSGEGDRREKDSAICSRFTLDSLCRELRRCPSANFRSQGRLDRRRLRIPRGLTNTIMKSEKLARTNG